MPDLSVIIPAYNEESRLPSTLESVYEYLEHSGHTFEIIVVDDGSLDGTCQVVEDFALHHDGLRLISYAPNQGKGCAVRTGMLAGRGDYLLMNDADGSSPIEEVDKLLAALKSGASVAIGSRAKADPEAVVKAQLHRKYIGNTFNLIVQSLLLPGIQDTQCGFKLFTRAAAHDIFAVARLNGYAFDVELLYIAKLRAYKISEVAINWTNAVGSKVNVLTDSPRMFLEVLRITFGAWTGSYRKA
ncbi:MAG: glycosyltransferase family 2 protein [Cyanobacteria bacterium REEB67]|nr:glycosyltransferase family 2 protein [Cyanobacteria bacterium REEB67]